MKDTAVLRGIWVTCCQEKNAPLLNISVILARLSARLRLITTDALCDVKMQRHEELREWEGINALEKKSRAWKP